MAEKWGQTSVFQQSGFAELGNHQFRKSGNFCGRGMRVIEEREVEWSGNLGVRRTVRGTSDLQV